MPEKRGCYLSITRLRDTVALNELQYIKAAENIYYSHWDGRDQIETQFHQFAPVRPERWCDLTVWVVDRETAAETRYRRATEEEKQDAQHTLVSMSMIHPVPSHWLSKLHYRAPIRTFSNGSAAGHVRKAEWLRRSIEQPPR